jgi:putative oxidoreductase
MNLLEKFEYWGDRHHPKWLDLIRIVLGIFLCYKGIDFLRNTSNLINVMQNASPFSDLIIILMGHFVTFAHIVGGFFLIIGLFTRAACLIQIPVLVMAIIFVNINATRDAFSPYSELFLSIIVFLLLIYFLIIGNGPLSVKIPPEEHLKEHQNYIDRVKGSQKN